MHSNRGKEGLSLCQWREHRQPTRCVRLPICVGSVRGEVYSVLTGNTPLLLSIPAMKALDMVPYMKEQEVGIRSLSITLKMLVAQTKHLAIPIAYNEEQGIQAPNTEGANELLDGEEPRVVSEAEDILIYYTYEAALRLLHQRLLPEATFVSTEAMRKPDYDGRGVHALDKVSQRPSQELKRAAGRQVRDNRMSVALKRPYSMAEQWCTRGFQDTVVFEVFGGRFGLPFRSLDGHARSLWA